MGDERGEEGVVRKDQEGQDQGGRAGGQEARAGKEARKEGRKGQGHQAEGRGQGRQEEEGLQEEGQRQEEEDCQEEDGEEVILILILTALVLAKRQCWAYALIVWLFSSYYHRLF